MTFSRLFATFALAAVLPAVSLAQADKAVVNTDHVRAELLAHAPEGLEAGKQVWVGLRITHQPEWHTYWKNPGDSGLPTVLTWSLPAGLEAGEIAWPAPHKLPVGPLMNYGYEGTVLLPVPLTVTPAFKPSLTGDAELRLQASWLVCQKECIPEEGSFTLKLPARGSTALNGGDFQAALAAVPQTLKSAAQVKVEGQKLEISVPGLPAAARGKNLEFFPETGEVIDPPAAWTQAWQGDTWTASVPLSPHRGASPDVLPVVLAAGSQAWRVEAPVTGTWPAKAAPAAAVSPALQEALRQNAAIPQGGGAPATASTTFLAALFGALLGGLILNLMPCVFPVLAIKVVGFTQHADDRRGHRISGMAYTVGVLVSFAALGALMLALRAAGEQLGWGFQLQSPAVVAALAALFTLIALNLAGVFEFRSFLPSSVATMEAKHPVANAFLTGVLAVAVASPCTAPFMGASLGFAATLPAGEAMAIFVVLGLGMALPYLAAAWIPAFARWLPKPGAWMETFRRLMAFPMFATVAWLVWVLGQQSGIDGAASLLALLVALSMVVWALTLRGRTRVVLSSVALAGLAFVAWSIGASITRPAVAGTVSAATDSRWQPWAPERVQQLVAAGKPVFVDFTAAWCVTCQLNKKTTLSRDDVLADFDKNNFTLLRADWTRRDPTITAALAQLGRNGVPVYVIYRPGRAPVVLSEVLGADEVRNAIAQM
ncbi:MAG TPA: thioredoxin family protein [Ramlibacter sp.]|uniref:protein-disulfide reductase DsbD family protein n=1 Tax=Ramlibacter sp. TaxID=1917967 RepID=UPI002D810A88|nr:thioredoxin family protein [Ramlibacter sp.]HET8747025.1 thioredoxin family protein [Ramlibacter sp.]